MKFRKTLTILVLGALAALGIVSVPQAASANYTDITCSTAWLEPHRALTNGDHINIDISQNGNKFQVNAYVDRNIQGGYDTLGLRIKKPSGEIAVPLSEQEVKSGRLTFNFGQYLTGTYTVEWAQFNNSYFNQDRNPYNYKTCGTPPQPEKPKPLQGTENLVDEPVCVVPNDGTATVTTTFTPWTQDWTWSGTEWVLADRVYGAPYTQTDTVENVEQCNPPVVPPAPANPTAVIDAVCGAATLTFTNPLIADANQLTASFVVQVNGEFYKAYSAQAGETVTDKLIFAEDTGIQKIEVFQAGTSEWKSLVAVEVKTDCVTPPVIPPTEPPVVVPPTEEPPVVTPPTEEPPVVTPPTETPKAVAKTKTAEVDTLAATGASGEEIGAIALGAFALITLGYVLFARRKKHQNFE